MLRGNVDISLRRFHDQYGDVVRFGPDRISFASAKAWQDIYGFSPGRAQIPKDPRAFVPGAVRDILRADDADHARFRRVLANAFSERALREQEGLVRGYVDLVIEKLRGYAGAGEKVNLCRWFNFTTFDIIGHLAFGRSFDCLTNSEYHRFVGSIMLNIKAFSWILLLRDFPVLMLAVKVLSKKAKSAKAYFDGYARETTMRRVQEGVCEEKRDFISYILKNRGKSTEMSEAEIVANANVLIVAGSETTATVLSGLTFWLLKTPRAMGKLVDEIRDAFVREEDINVLEASKLPYLKACLDEGLRLFPPVPGGIPRRNTTAVIVDGVLVPPNVSYFQALHLLPSALSSRYADSPFSLHIRRPSLSTNLLLTGRQNASTTLIPSIQSAGSPG